ncbi:MAG: leucine-rich repeat domain-containing protein [Bacteroidales bacterium]|nr:leucine-rich repeat domain-containing protein [Bacteroidales bacterium]
MKFIYFFTKTFITFALAISVGLQAFAHDFEVDGIYYNYLSDKNVEVTYKGNSYSSYPNEYTGIVTIPSSVTYNWATYSVTEIDDMAFYYCTGLTGVNIPNSITTIGEGAFYYCTSFTSIAIPNSVTYIKNKAFFYTKWYNNQADGILYLDNCCLGYKGTKPTGALTLKEGTRFIGNSVFYNCDGLTEITIPNSVTSIGDYAFNGCTGLTKITIPNSVTSIGANAFINCTNLTEVNISDLSAWCKIEFTDHLANPLYYANHLHLNGSKIKDLVIPNDITQIKNYAFSNCTELTKVTIPNSTTSIGDYAFCNCAGLTEINIPNSVTSIGNEVFSFCINLTEVTIGYSVSKIGDYAFRNCSDLKSIVTLNPTPPTCSSRSSFYDYSNATIYVPKDSYSRYFIDDVWGKFTNIKKLEHEWGKFSNMKDLGQ